MGLAMIDPESLGDENLCPECKEAELKAITGSRDGYDYEVIAVVCPSCGFTKGDAC